ncbi:MAG: hypothetical protein D6753_08890 [Planctomycetota bacterium]|nr:MAG: hypothetical protein D6753_08890 [Planctomycetota bacterium]
MKTRFLQKSIIPLVAAVAISFPSPAVPAHDLPLNQWPLNRSSTHCFHDDAMHFVPRIASAPTAPSVTAAKKPTSDAGQQADHRTADIAGQVAATSKRTLLQIAPPDAGVPPSPEPFSNEPNLAEHSETGPQRDRIKGHRPLGRGPTGYLVVTPPDEGQPPMPVIEGVTSSKVVAECAVAPTAIEPVLLVAQPEPGEPPAPEGIDQPEREPVEQFWLEEYQPYDWTLVDLGRIGRKYKRPPLRPALGQPTPLAIPRSGEERGAVVGQIEREPVFDLEFDPHAWLPQAIASWSDAECAAYSLLHTKAQVAAGDRQGEEADELPRYSLRVNALLWDNQKNGHPIAEFDTAHLLAIYWELSLETLAEIPVGIGSVDELDLMATSASIVGEQVAGDQVGAVRVDSHDAPPSIEPQATHPITSATGEGAAAVPADWQTLLAEWNRVWGSLTRWADRYRTISAAWQDFLQPARLANLKALNLW